MSDRSVEIAVCVDLSEGAAPSRVDREAGVIKGVKLLGWTSQNGRTYDPAGVDPAMYEGRAVNFNHHKGAGDRSVYDRFGRIANAVKRQDGLYGDLEYLRSHPYAESVAEAAERMPNVYGLSHTARGVEKRSLSGNTVEKVESVQSVDLVGDPATVAGLYESRGGGMAKLTVQDIQEALKDKRPKYSQALREMAEAGILSPGAPMDDPGATPGDAASGADHEQAILDACKVCIDDAALDRKGKLKKIGQLLKMIGGGGAAGGDDEPEEGAEEPEGEEDDVAKQESVEIRAKLARLEARERLRSAADDANVKLPRALVESVRDDLTADQAKALVSDLKTGGHGGNKPRSAAPQQGAARAGGVQESKQQAAGGVPEDRKERAAWLNGKG